MFWKKYSVVFIMSLMYFISFFFSWNIFDISSFVYWKLFELLKFHIGELIICDVCQYWK